MSSRRRWSLAALLLLLIGAAALFWYGRRDAPPVARKISEIRRTITPDLTQQFQTLGMTFGRAMHIRIFKQERELEVWGDTGPVYRKFKTYPICTFSGELGPKLREGDRQSPEGVYEVSLAQLNPASSYHLSFNLGFPNAHDRFHGRTGSHLMVHGSCVSIGCYAMTDPVIEEIYVAMEAALRGGQGAVPVHIFPFRMTAANLARHATSPWQPFWGDLQAVHDAFDARHRPPAVTHRSGRYVVTH